MKPLTIFYASNVDENWEGLKNLIEQIDRENVDLLLLTNVFGNPLSEEEQTAYKHAYRHIQHAYKLDTSFADIQQFINSFRSDPSRDIVTISAKKILQLIESGRAIYRKKIAILKNLLEDFYNHILIVPGPFENIDLIREIDPKIASHYLNLANIDVNGIIFLGIGGQATLEDACPHYFQNRDYMDGTEQANEELREIMTEDVDVLVSYAPIRYFTDNVFEERNVREYLCDHLPGHLILTSQKIGQNKAAIKTATDAELIKGGYFGKNSLEKELSQKGGYFWKLVVDKKGLVKKNLLRVAHKETLFRR